MKNVPEDYRIEDLLDVQTIVSVRFCYVTVLMLISTSTPELLERVSPEQESRRAQTLELRRSSSDARAQLLPIFAGLKQPV
jgi:hypothetical protein